MDDDDEPPHRHHFASDMQMFNKLFVAMGALLLAVATWIGSNVSHIPAIEQKMDDFIATAGARLNKHENRLDAIDGALQKHDHRIQTLEDRTKR